MSVIDPRSKINSLNQASLLGSLNANTGLEVFKTANSNFIRQNSENDYSLANVTASQSYATQYDQLGNMQRSLRKDFAEYETAKENMNSIKEKVAEIKALVKSARDGSISGTALDDAQETINNLVSEINGLVDTTKIGDKKVFDGSFQQKLQEDLSGKSSLSIDFQRSADTNRPLNVLNSMTVTNDHKSSLKILFANEKYIVAAAEYDANGESVSAAPRIGNGSVQIFDAVTKQLIRQIESPLTDIDNERFGYTVSVDGDNILIGTRNQGWWDGDNNGVNNYPEYDRDFAGAAFLYDIPSGDLITSFTKSALAAKNPSIDLGLRSENDVNPNLTSRNAFSSFGSGLRIEGDRVYIYKAQGSGADLNGQGIMEFTLDGTFVKQHNVAIDVWLPVYSLANSQFSVTDEYIIAPNGLDSNGANTRDGSVSFLDKVTGERRELRSPERGNFKTFGWSSDIQGDLLVVSESGFHRGNVYAAGTSTLIGYDTPEGYVDLATWNSRQNNGGSFDGFGGAVRVYSISALMEEYDTAYNDAITAGQTASQAAETATNFISRSDSAGLLRTFDKNTLASQGVDIDTYDEFGYNVMLDGANLVISSRLDDDAGVNSSATYVFDVNDGELVSKVQGRNFNATSGTKIYTNASGTTINEFDFAPLIGSPTNGIDLDTNKTRAASLGARSSQALSGISISTNIASLNGHRGLATDQTVLDMEAIETNLMRMESNFNAITSRVSNALDRVGSRMEVLRNRKDAVDLNLSGYFNAKNIPVQVADRRKALDLLP